MVAHRFPFIKTPACQPSAWARTRVLAPAPARPHGREVMAQASDARNRHALTHAEQRRRREALAALLTVLGVFAGVLSLIVLYLWLSWQKVYWADRVTEARAQLAEQETQHRLLEAQVAQAFSLERIARLARQLGLVEPETLRYWPLDP